MLDKRSLRSFRSYGRDGRRLKVNRGRHLFTRLFRAIEKRQSYVGIRESSEQRYSLLTFNQIPELRCRADKDQKLIV